ncbi:MAG TPA: DUF2062 domain-containing protein [Candidatus Sulfotelmatobacter sp.]|nr:DUF2062 domain-containing protein [Candidatus Sulfotelmatobacter sp.]
MPKIEISGVAQPLRRVAATLFQEHLDPRHAAAAVFLGIVIGVIPIYGFQTLAVIGLAALFRLNKPLAFAATFVNNPLLQPFLIVGSVELGHFILAGRLVRLALPRSVADYKSQLGAWLIGSVGLGLLLGAFGAAVVYVVLQLKSQGSSPRREAAKFVNSLFAGCPRADRGFVRWKVRLDRCFDFLAAEDLAAGTVVDLGCGYGIALGFAAFRDHGRRLVGCDLDERRIAAARTAFQGMNAEFAVGDVRNFELPQAGLIFIFDVLQYLTGVEQKSLLQRCARALAPGGKLIFRVPDRGVSAASRLSVAFDRLIFFLQRNHAGPVVLSAAEYQGALSEAGLQIDQRRMRNRLPLAHLLFVAAKTELPSPGCGEQVAVNQA